MSCEEAAPAAGESSNATIEPADGSESSEPNSNSTLPAETAIQEAVVEPGTSAQQFDASARDTSPEPNSDSTLPTEAAIQEAVVESGIPADPLPSEHPTPVSVTSPDRVPAASSSSALVYASEISPFPKVSATGAQSRRRSATGGSPMVLTDSPYKLHLEQSLASKPKLKTAAKKSLGVKGKADKSRKRRKPEMEEDITEKVKRKPQTGKGKRKPRKVSSTSTAGQQMSQQDNCTLCHARFGDDSDKKKGEEWIQCCKCGHWFHESCGEDCGLLDDDVFYCKDCV